MMMTKPSKGIGAAIVPDVPLAVEAYFAAINGQNRAALEELLAAGFTLTLPQPSVAVTFQRSEAIEFFLTTPGSVLDLKSAQVTFLTVVQQEDVCVLEFRMKANILAGGTYDNIYVSWFGLAGAKIAYCREHYDTAYAMSALHSGYEEALHNRDRTA
jgi:ketosteroid isomerase-like protein